MRTFIVLSAAVVASTCAHGAAISVQTNGNQPALVVVDGELAPRDGDDFQSKTSFLSKAIVAFRSDGGSVVAGIQIGESIRLKGFTTFVPENARCASACAVAWLGGTQRLMAASARIGFHAAYNADSGQETGVGNALVGAYLNKIGLPYQAVIYIMQAKPSSMTWLSISDARKVGIDVSMLGASSPASTAQPPNLGGLEGGAGEPSPSLFSPTPAPHVAFTPRKAWDSYAPSTGRYIHRNPLVGSDGTYKLVATEHDAAGNSNGGSACTFTATGWSDCLTNAGEHY